MTTPNSKTASSINRSGMPFIKLFVLYFTVSLLAIAAVTGVSVAVLAKNLPEYRSLETIYIEQTLSTVIYSSDGVPLRSLAQTDQKRRLWVRYADIPQCMVDAIVVVEDRRFFDHWGFSSYDFSRALVHDIVTMSTDQGGSTITQQLAKNLYFTSEKLFSRKIRELLTAIQIERRYSKEEILEMYLNHIDLSNNALGIQAAAQTIFGKDIKDVTVSEAAMLAGMYRNSSWYNPRSESETRRRAALERRNLVLQLMARQGKISQATANEEISRPVLLADRIGMGYGVAPYFVEHVRRQLIDHYGTDYALNSGLAVHTTIDSRLQKIAEDSLRTHLAYLQKNYADVQLHYVRPPGLTDEEAYQDSLNKTVVQGALVAMDVKTGAILAMVGGAGVYGENQFNRATQAARQAGSVFKPFVYTTALDNGWRCSDTILDAYVCYENVDGQGAIWEPQNFEKTFHGIMSLRDAMKASVNIVAIKLLNDSNNRGVGPMNVVRYAQKMGMTTVGPSDAVMSLAIGTAHIRLLDLVTAFAIFPNLGIKTDSFSIESIYDKNGGSVFRQPNGEGAKSEVLDPGVASLMVTMLKSVTSEPGGTAYNTLGSRGLRDRPSGGKTGTGNEYKDAWYIGFTPQIVCGIWVGFDSEETTLGGNAYGTGATAALPIWAGFIRGASEVLNLPKDDFVLSQNITTMRVCRDSHLKATPSCPDTSVYTEYFIRGTEITTPCNIHDLSRAPGDARYDGAGTQIRRGF